MRSVLLLSVLLATICSAVLFGYPLPYYVYVVHEILFILIFLWFISTTVVKKVKKLSEGVTLFFVIFFVVLSPVTAVLAPDYPCEGGGDPMVHVAYLAEEIGERPYISENEEKASGYIQDVLKRKGGSPVGDDNVFLIVEGKKEDTVLFCAHYDSVPGSPGADDNASGVSVLLELSIPDNPVNTIVIAFFTGEEVGLVESRQVARDCENLVGVICVDTVGVGKDFHVSSLRKNRSKSFFLSQVVYGLTEAIPSIGPLYSDHVPFNEKGVRAVGLTRSINREYPHIHSERDKYVDRDILVETGAAVQELVYHFSYAEYPYRFVYVSLLISVVGSGVLAVIVQNLISKGEEHLLGWEGGNRV
jgi:hypothetical protein